MKFDSVEDKQSNSILGGLLGFSILSFNYALAKSEPTYFNYSQYKLNDAS